MRKLVLSKKRIIFTFSVINKQWSLRYKRMIVLKNRILRIAWIIPNVMSYLFIIGLAFWVILNRVGLREINRFSIYVVFIILFCCVTLFGSYRIRNWIKNGEL